MVKGPGKLGLLAEATIVIVGSAWGTEAGVCYGGTARAERGISFR
jgi:hypothetical protein